MTAPSPSAPALLEVDFGQDPLHTLAERVIADHAGQLPDLSRAVIFVPEREAAPRLRRCLLEAAAARGAGALLGPHIHVLQEWVGRLAPQALRICDPHARVLHLVEALLAHPEVLHGANPWGAADALLELFDELTHYQAAPDPEVDAFAGRLAGAYGATAQALSGLGREALLVHTLWGAWQAQLDALGLVDPAAAYVRRLQGAAAALTPQARIYAAGFIRLQPAERAWLAAELQRGRATVLLHGRTAPGAAEEAHPAAPVAGLCEALGGTPRHTPAGTPYGALLDTVFAGAGRPLRERSTAAAAQHPNSPLAARLRVFEAGDAEAEARGIELQVRRWLIAGRRHLAVVTEDRRLARRVRALLERADVVLEDAAGWALSTTSAAAALERWLQCVEEDFEHRALLDLLKSPFVFPARSRAQYLELVYRFEQDIVTHENVGRGLQRYRSQLARRSERLHSHLQRWSAETAAGLDALLQTLGEAAAPLARLAGARGSGPAELLGALRESLGRLGMEEALREDAAGEQLLQTLDAMAAGASQSSIRLSWLEFRGWLGRTLEQAHFRTGAGAGPVFLLGLRQSALQCFDGLILAGATREHLPGGDAHSPFFNNAVRRELGLPTNRERQSESFYHFRRLLEAAPEVLVTVRREQDGEAVPPSPWLERLQAFHELGWGERLADGGLAALARRPEAAVFRADTAALPRPRPAPAVCITESLLPPSISASAYQQLMDCPYQFFAARCLELAPSETVREVLQSSDYGQRVHRCLEAFHGGVAGLPGPFQGRLQEDVRDAAVALLEEVSAAVFSRDVEDNFLHRAWLQRWRALIPAYVDWQIARAADWQVAGVEVQAERPLNGRCRLKGRLDRVDRGPAGIAVLDYKTGMSPGDREVRSGESVQLPVYALLAQGLGLGPVARVELLALHDAPVRGRTALEDEELAALAAATERRLQGVLEAAAGGRALPAWGDSTVCGRCEMSGLCRRQAWSEDEAALPT